jgi:hypothetical protein
MSLGRHTGKGFADIYHIPTARSHAQLALRKQAAMHPLYSYRNQSLFAPTTEEF